MSDPRVARVANVLLWGVATSRHPDATFEGWAEQILKVLDSENLAAADALRDIANAKGRHANVTWMAARAKRGLAALGVVTTTGEEKP